jgi:hypothetical protein
MGRPTHDPVAVFYIIHDSSFGRVFDRERIQPLIEPALSATGEERQRRMEELANIMKDDVQRMTLMDTFVIYGMVEDLKWEPRPIRLCLEAPRALRRDGCVKGRK